MKKVRYIISAVFLFLFVVFGGLFMPKTVSVRAEETAERQYSDVMTDLRKSENFDENRYPANDEDYSVQLITIAESNKNELFLYVYQPAHNFLDLQCKKVSISLGFSPNGQDLEPELYDLGLVSTDGVFNKYLVKDLPIPNEECHYYNIIALYRDVSALVDGTIENGTTDGKSFEVGEQWCCYVKDGALVYEKSIFKTVKIETVQIGYIAYEDGFTFSDFFHFSSDTGCWSYFYAFNFDNEDIRCIYDARMSFKSTKTTSKRKLSELLAYDVEREEPVLNEVLLSDKDSVSYNGRGLGSRDYKWNRIYSTSEFLEYVKKDNGSLSETTIDLLNNSQYVFCFAEYSYAKEDILLGSAVKTTYTKVEDVSVLTISYMDLQGDVKNLGVVSDIVSPDSIEDGRFEADDETWWEKIVMLLGLLIIAVVIGPFIGPILTVVFSVLGFVLKMVSKVLSLPFKLLGSGKRGR